VPDQSAVVEAEVVAVVVAVVVSKDSVGGVHVSTAKSTTSAPSRGGATMAGMVAGMGNYGVPILCRENIFDLNGYFQPDLAKSRGGGAYQHGGLVGGYGRFAQHPRRRRGR